jgi:hypothetical protein
MDGRTQRDFPARVALGALKESGAAERRLK